MKGITYKQVLDLIKRLLVEDKQRALEELESVGAKKTDLPLNITTIIFAKPEELLNIFYTYLPQNSYATELLFHSYLELLDEPRIIGRITKLRIAYQRGEG